MVKQARILAQGIVMLLAGVLLIGSLFSPVVRAIGIGIVTLATFAFILFRIAELLYKLRAEGLSDVWCFILFFTPLLGLGSVWSFFMRWIFMTLVP